MILEKYSFGVGDRFSQQGEAQLQAIKQANDEGIPIVPVWNKSNREHQIIGSKPEHTRQEADDAVKKLNWDKNYYVDADHINLKIVDDYISHADFFTLDVADYIGSGTDEQAIKEYIDFNAKYLRSLNVPGLGEIKVDEDQLNHIASKFLGAVGEASKIYKHIANQKGTDNFIAEISMDEVDEPQTPVELFFILSAISFYAIPAQTIAPKFTGRFNKGVDYIGDVEQFRKEFEQDLLVIDFAIKEFGLPDNLKLSVHSGSDKFSIYPVMGQLIKKHDKGIHVKTAGTTWLEELIGLALSGGKALEMARKIYELGFERKDELCAPYATVIDIDYDKIPLPETVNTWDGKKFADTLEHKPDHPDYNLHFRQLIHVSYKIAAELGEDYVNLLTENAKIVGKQVTKNIFERHIKRLFLS